MPSIRTTSLLLLPTILLTTLPLALSHPQNGHFPLLNTTLPSPPSSLLLPTTPTSLTSTITSLPNPDPEGPFFPNPDPAAMCSYYLTAPHTRSFGYDPCDPDIISGGEGSMFAPIVESSILDPWAVQDETVTTTNHALQTANAPTPTGMPAITVGTQVLTPLPGSGYEGAGQTLLPGAQITLTLTRPSELVVTVSLAQNEESVVVNGVPTPIIGGGQGGEGGEGGLRGLGSAQVGEGGLLVLTLGGNVITPTRLSAGPAETAGSGEAVPTGELAEGGVQSSSAEQSPGPAQQAAQEEAGQMYGYVLADGQTLTAGGVVTIAGTAISLAPGATELVVGGTTTPIEVPVSTDVARETGVGSEGFTRTGSGGGIAVETGRVEGQGGKALLKRPLLAGFVAFAIRMLY